MRIASIDPGFNTGLAIAIMCNEENIILKKYFLGTFTDEPNAVIKLVLASRSQVCVMEAKPHNTPDSKTVPNTKIQVGLGDLSPWEIGPGTWKPFMRSRLMELEPWAPETQHERDAMAILFYFVQINFSGRKVQYV